MTVQLIGVLIGGGIALTATILNVGYNWLRYKSERQFALAGLYNFNIAAKGDFPELQSIRKPKA